MIDLYRDPDGENALSSTMRKGSQIYSFQPKEDIPAAVQIHSVKKNSISELKLGSEASNITASRDHHNLSAESS